MTTRTTLPYAGIAARAVGVSCALALALTACGADDPAPTGSSGSTPTTASSQTTTPTTVGDPVRDAIIAAMQGQSQTIVELASNEETTLRELPASALKGWKVLELTLATPPHPRRAMIGLADDGRAVILMSQPANFATVAEGASVTSADQAVELAQTYIESTGNLAQPSYAVASIDEVRFLPRPNADQAALIAKTKKEQASAVTPPNATKDGTGWTVVTWWVSAGQLVKHETSIAGDGSVKDAPTVVVDRLPVPISP